MKTPVICIFCFITSVCFVNPLSGASIQTTSSMDSIRLLLQNYQYEDALKVSREVGRSDESLLPKVYEGMALRGLMRYPEAVACFEEVVLVDSLNFTAMVELAHTYLQLGEYRQALEFLSKANGVHPSGILRSEMAAVYFALDDFVKAKSFFLFFLQNDSLNVINLKNTAKCYDLMGTADSAIVYFERVLLQAPMDYYATYRVCNLYIKSKNFDRALEISEAYRCKDSTNSAINRVDAYLYYLKQDYSESLARFSRCFQNGDTTLFTLKYLGTGYYMLQNFESSNIYLGQAYRQDTLDMQLCYLYGLSFTRSYYKEKGIKYITRAIELLTPDRDYLSGMYQNLADAYQGSGKTKDGLRAYLKAYELTPQDTMLLFRIAQYYDRSLSDTVPAIKYYTEFIRLCNDTDTPLERDPIPERSPRRLELTYYSAAVNRLKELQDGVKKN